MQVLNTCGASTHGVCCEGAYSKLPQVTPARGSTRLSGDFAASVRLRKKWEIDSAFPATAKTYFFAHSGIRSADLAFSASDRVRSPQVTAGNDRPCAVLERRVDLSF